MAIHNHQPVGNFSWVFDQAYSAAYLPMLEAIERHPGLHFSLHYSGPLVDWLLKAHPDFIERLSAIARSGQVELMSSGYYEPVLPSIPDTDKLGQIRKMNDAIERMCGTAPTGLWLTERVWEPHLPGALVQSGIKWTVVDDTHFKWVGIDDKDMFGYYITEEGRHPVKVFPISKYLRYSIPWKPVEEVVAYFRAEADASGSRVAVLGDDGEKFGIWPGTSKLCWKDKWVDRFFDALEQNGEWLKTLTLGECARSLGPVGRIYLPCASYDEMTEWALPWAKAGQYASLKRTLEGQHRADILQFMRGSFWRQFLVKYPEANRLHKKMLRVHYKVHRASTLGHGGDVGTDELWQAQCNEPYWHGVFGGVYLADLRATAYRHLIQAENKADQAVLAASGAGATKQPARFQVESSDIDVDGRDEFLVDSSNFSVYLSPAEGGSIFELDLRQKDFNLLSTLARRPEAYHEGLKHAAAPQQPPAAGATVASIHDRIAVKDEGIAEMLSYDRYPRSGFIDHFLDAGTTLQDFVRCSYRERGDFAAGAYTVAAREQDNRLQIRLSREGLVRQGDDALGVLVEKQFIVDDPGQRISVNYRLTNRSKLPLDCLYACECNFNLLGGGHNEWAYYEVPGVDLEDAHLDSRGELDGVSEIKLGNRALNIEIGLDIRPAVRLWRFPVETVSNSESGVEGLYQASCVVLLKPLRLAAGQSDSLEIVLST